MAEKQKNMTEKTRDSMEKAAYVALGAPTAALKALNARISDLRDAVNSSRKEMSDDLAREIDDWISEGEHVVERAMDRLRSSDVAEEIKASARSTKEAAQAGIDKATGLARSGMDVAGPDEELTTISGIGPSNAGKLDKVGVVGISRFLERTDTQDGIEKLATSSGISEDTLASWRDQVDLGRLEGVGESYLDLLHRVGIWTFDQLASASPAELAEEMRSLDIPDQPDQMPTESVIREWKAEAKRIAAG